MAAPAAFANASSDVAGRIAGAMFSIESRAGLAVAVALILLQRMRSRRATVERPGRLFDADLGLLLGAVFCTVAGYFALQPMLAAARAGAGALSFGTLHAISMVFYALKALLVATLAWRLSAR